MGASSCLAGAALAVALFTAAMPQGTAQPASPPGPPDFGRDVVPIFESNCLRCHNAVKQEAGLVLGTYEDIMRGGDDGPPVVPGHADDSPMIQQLEGRAKPKMPPKTDLRPEDIAVLRAWIAGGAKYSPRRRVSLDDKVVAIEQTAAVLPEIPSVAFGPDGSKVAVAGYREVLLLDLKGEVRARLGGLSDQVRTVAWSPDGEDRRRRRRHAGRLRRAGAVRRGDRRGPPRDDRSPRLRLPCGLQPRRQAPRLLWLRPNHPRLGHDDRQPHRSAEGTYRGGLSRWRSATTMRCWPRPLPIGP